jgi:tight adherence protein B
VTRRLAAAALAALVLPAAASASVSIQSVDPSGYPQVSLTVLTSSPSKSPPALLEDGAWAYHLHAVNLGATKSIVLAVDHSQSMRGEPLRKAVAAARAFVAAKRLQDRVAVSAFANDARLVSGFTLTKGTAAAALRSIRAVGRVQGTRLYDDVVLAADALSHEARDGRVILLVTDGQETTSKAKLREAIRAAQRAHALVYVVAIRSSRFTPEPLQRLAAKTGGRYREAAAGALTAVYKQIGDELGRSWRLEYVSTGVPGKQVRLRTAVRGQGIAERTVTLPLLLPGRHAKLPFLFTRSGTRVLAAGIGLLVLLGATAILASIREGWVRGLVLPHLGKPKERPVRRSLRERLQAFAGLFRVTERLLSRTALWRRLGRLVERADLPVRTVEFVYLMLVISLGLGAFLLVTGAGAGVVFVACLVGLALPIAYARFRIWRRRASFDEQLPDILATVAASLKAGHSFRSALQGIVDEGVEPAGKELKRVLAETRLGRPIEEALADMATRVESKNWEFIVTAVGIQSQVGGSLAGLFDMVSDMIRQRHQFARKVKALTAMGRMSAYVLIGVPIFLGAMLTLVSPEYMAPLWHTSSGHMIVAVTVVMVMIGAALLKKIVSFRT